MNALYRSIAKSMAGKYLAYAIQFASLMLLARLFTPEIFGLVAAVQVFYVFFQLVAEAGFGPAVIGLDTLSEEDRDGIFGFTLALGIFLGAGFLAIAPFLIKFYETPRVADAIPYIAVGLVLNAWSILPTALLQRQQSFLHIAFSTAIAECVATLAVFLAQIELDPLHALSLRLPVFSLIYFLLVYITSERTEFKRPAAGFKFNAIRPLLKVSGYQLAFNAINFFSRYLDKILVAKYLGASNLGIYDRSYQLMRYPLQLLGFAMAPAIQPALRNHANDVSYVRKVHQDLAFRISILGSVFAAIIYFLAEPIILLAFGRQWVSATPVVEILAITIPVQVILSTSGGFFQTFKRTDLLFLCGVLTAAANVAAIIYGVSRGSLVILCWSLLISFHINFLIVYLVVHKMILGGGFSSFLARMIPAASVVLALTFYHFRYSQTTIA